jgi:small subunit ribosomal protein S6
METVTKKKLYEGMFLVDSAQASDWDKVIATLEAVLEKADGEVVSIRKWDDRKLAYEINGKARGTYILCYFRANGRKIREVEKAVQLSEQIMRVLILCAESMSKEDIEKETPAMKAEKQESGRRLPEKVREEQLSEEEQARETVKSVE